MCHVITFTVTIVTSETWTISWCSDGSDPEEAPPDPPPASDESRCSEPFSGRVSQEGGVLWKAESELSTTDWEST